MALINAKDVSFSYDKQNDVIKNLNLQINDGEYIAVIGHNGSGKSTFARLFNGLLKPDKGEIIVDGFNSNDKKQLFEIRKRVGVVFQNPDNQIVASIVEDDVAFGPENVGIKREEIAKRIDFALNAVGMSAFRHASPTRLSGGQKQRIAIAGVLSLLPKVLILDESTAMLDPQGRRDILSVVDKLNKQQKITVINITHYMDEVIFADRVIVLSKGEIALSGTPREIFSKHAQLKELGLELPFSAYVSQKLIERGIKLPEGILTTKELGVELCKLLPKI